METTLVATRVVPMLGHPVAQVATPPLWNGLFAARGQDAVCVPLDLPETGVAAFFAMLRSCENMPGALTTVPHKLAFFAACDRVEPDAAFLRSVNTIRREADGTLVGEMFDGHGMMDAIEAAGQGIGGLTVQLCGAGAAGSAIALQAVRRGAARLRIHDPDVARAVDLAGRLTGIGKTVVTAGLQEGAQVLINASPAGSLGIAPPPFTAAMIAAATCVADALTDPAQTELIARACAAGCITVRGQAMAEHQGARMRAFLGLEQA